MRSRALALLVLTATLAAPLAAQFRRGDVFLETGVHKEGTPPVASASDMWLHVGGPWTARS